MRYMRKIVILIFKNLERIGIKMRLQELCDFYEFVEEGIKCFFFLILGAAFLLIILLFSNFLAPKKIDVPSENAI